MPIHIHIYTYICIYDLSSHPSFLFTAPAKTLCGEMMRGVGGVLLTPSGHRFVDELLPRDQVCMYYVYMHIYRSVFF